MDASLAPSTRRSYRSGQSRFLQFCTSFHLLHPSGSPYPASESTLELFASYLSSSLTYQTIKCYLAAVRSLHIERGLPDPLSNAPRLELVLRGIKRSQAARCPAKPARLPVTRATLLTIRASLNLSAPDHCMFWAAACTAWFGFLRVSEFTCPASGFDPATHLSVQDLAVDDHQLPSAVLVRIKASKTDPFRKGVQLLLPRTGGPSTPSRVTSPSAGMHPARSSASPPGYPCLVRTSLTGFARPWQPPAYRETIPVTVSGLARPPQPTPPASRTPLLGPSVAGLATPI